MTDHQFTKLFAYMEKRFDKIEQKLDTKTDKSQSDQILNTVDAIYQRLDTLETEQAAVAHQTSRQEAWIEKTAQRFTSLDYNQSN